MMTALKTIRIVVIILLAKNSYCQDGFNQDLYRLQQYAVNAGHAEALSNYNPNFIQRDPIAQGRSQHPAINDDYNTDDYSRAGRSKKVYRIKNPFQPQTEEDKQQGTNISQDSATGASNQYAAMQYSLPPEEFLQQMRAENQYHLQQQQPFSTQVSTSSYTATPQPQYQFSTIPASNYDVSQQTNQFSTVESKSFTPIYQSNANSYQYNNQNTFNSDSAQSTPIPSYMSTLIPNDQYTGTPNNYLSSSSPIYLSSPQSIQQYASSPSNTLTGTSDYNNNRVATIGSNSLNHENRNDVSKRMQIDHYDNAGNGMHYPNNIQNQYQSEFVTSTASPISSPYPDNIRDLWQNSLNSGYKQEQSNSQTQYQPLRYNNNQQDNNRFGADTSKSDTHRIGTIPSTNSLFLNFIQPDYNFLNSRTGDSKPESSQTELYSHGDYGWKLTDKKPLLEPEGPNYFKYQIHSVQPDTGVVSQMSFQMDSRKPYNYEQNSKPVHEKAEVDEFGRAAAKAHESFKQQIEANKYLSNNQYGNNPFANSFERNSFNNDERQRNKYNSNNHIQTQTEIVTVSPSYYMNTKDNSENKPKLPFDHNKALKNIVPIDVSNVVQNSDSQGKLDVDSNKYAFATVTKDKPDYSLKPYSRPDPYYKDKDTSYTFNINKKPEDLFIDKLKQMEQSMPYQDKQKISELLHNHGAYLGNRHLNQESSQTLKFANQFLNNHRDNNAQSSANVHQLEIQHPQSLSDVNNILKLNDIPYRLTQSLHSNKDFDQPNIPTPLPLQINQNVDNHNIDIAAEILSKLIANKHSVNRPELDSQRDNFLSTINGFKVVNPYNIDLKLIAEMLKGKQNMDDSHMSALRGDFNKPLPVQFDVSQLQHLINFKTDQNLLLNNGFGLSADTFTSGRFPYQGVKYSRSEEDTENIPIADSSNNHPIGAVIEQDDVTNGQDILDLTESADDNLPSNDEDKNKSIFSSSHKTVDEKHILPSVSYSGRHTYKRKYPKPDMDEPYPLLKPPPPRSSRHRSIYSRDKNSSHRRRIRPKMHRVYKSEPLFESLDDIKHTSHIKRSLSVDEEKSDTISENENT